MAARRLGAGQPRRPVESRVNSPPAVSLFLLSLLALSVAAVIVTIRAVGQARDGFEDAAGFHGEAPAAARPARESDPLPTLGSRPAGLAS